MFSTRSDDDPAGKDEGRSRGASLRWPAIALGLVAVGYVGYLFQAYSIFHGRHLHYPRDVLVEFEADAPDDLGTRLAGKDVPSGDEAESCRPSATVAMQIELIEQATVRNTWVPARPLYKFGVFGLVDFDDTPWFDNKAAEQLGMLDIMRRTGIEMTDSLGRIRGSSLENPQLAAAQSALQIDERAWFVNNPFSRQQNTISPSAASSYESAIPLYERYNRDLASCDATFDTRADNLRAVLSRFTATIGATTVELERRSKAFIYDVESDEIVRGEGNNRGWFDFQADNHFHRARGKMYALHGILQAMRVDFADVIEDRNVGPVWDKMQATVGEATMLDPWIVSNGSSDGVLAPDHLTVMAEMILRARTSMVEVRDILSS